MRPNNDENSNNVVSNKYQALSKFRILLISDGSVLVTTGDNQTSTTTTTTTTMMSVCEYNNNIHT